MKLDVVFSFQLCDWLWSFILPKLDIRCVSSNGYIKWFNLNRISIAICWLNRYIRWFDLSWIFVVICTTDVFIESFDRVYRKIERVWIFIVLQIYEHNHESMSYWFSVVDSESLSILIHSISSFYLFYYFTQQNHSISELG